MYNFIYSISTHILMTYRVSGNVHINPEPSYRVGYRDGGDDDILSQRVQYGCS